VVLLAVRWNLPPSASTADGAEDDSQAQLDIPELTDAQPLDAFAVITERPIFNETRQPIISGAEGEGDEEEELVEEEVDAPEVQLAGVVITPSIRMVTLRRKDNPLSLVAFEGQPLEGDYGSWQVSRIQERQVTLSSGTGDELELKLEVHKAKIAPPPKAAAEAGKKDAAAGQSADAEEGEAPLTRAEEIRQRIAERREELRRAAEEKEQDEADSVDYSTAIQSMIGSRNKNRDSQDDQ
jgi:general secretion pathway protein N